MEAMVLSQRMVKVGRVVKPFGTDGRVLVDFFTDSWEDFSLFEYLSIDRCSGELESFQLHSGRLICRIEGVIDRDAAENLRGSFLRVPHSSLPQLDDGSYYHFDLVGCTVEDEHGEELGKIADVRQSGANDNWVVRNGVREFMVPAVKEYILSVDVEARLVRIRVVEGMF